MSALYEGLAEIFEVDAAEIGPGFSLPDHNWDSLAIVSTIALVDEVEDLMLNGAALSKCVTVADLEALIAKTRAG
ncbi:acyl carrier protein [Phenylobacterium sp.]|uniref:acyl carrier protein n=1 Tax=Phenylobacterium sp. TaxID=1871053 RepID=UPI0012187A5D|nr:acyl carrier protein [Phenylobacterium sp.]THD64089.1 MAG: acyl carrier protein [Phenylobacterium sp.]